MKAKTKAIIRITAIASGFIIGTFIMGGNIFTASYWQEAAEVNQWGWFGVFFGIFALCYFSFATYMLFKVIYSRRLS